VGQTIEWDTFPTINTIQLQDAFSIPQQCLINHLPENRVLLAINAIRSTPRLSIRRAAEIYDVPRSTIYRRMNGQIAKAESHNARSNLTRIEEEVIVQYVLDQDSRGFSPPLPRQASPRKAPLSNLKTTVQK
jgi:predicted XRE-type DNA-binding protein